MNPRFSPKIIACLALLFTLGGVCGYALAIRQVRAAAHEHWEERWLQNRLREDTDRLHLTPGQVEEFRPLYQRMKSEISAVRQGVAAGITAASTKHYQALWETLPPEQRKELEKLSEERRARALKDQ